MDYVLKQTFSKGLMSRFFHNQITFGIITLMFGFTGVTIHPQIFAAAKPTDPTIYNSRIIKIGSEAWIETKLRQYPELLWLLTTNTSQTQDKSAFDQAIRSLIHLHLFVSGSRVSYSTLLNLSSDEEDALSFKQFMIVHKQLSKYLESNLSFDNPLKMLETAVVFKYLEQAPKAVTIFKPYFNETRTGYFYFKALQVLQTFPDLLPSYSRLSTKQKEVFQHLRKLGDYSHLLNLSECPKKELRMLGQTKKPIMLLDLFLYSFDLCGSNNYSQDTFYNLSSLVSMLQEHSTVEEAFSRYLTYRANRLGFSGQSRTEMSLVRLATLMNISSSNEISALKWGFKNLSEKDAQVIINSFYSLNGEYRPHLIHGLPELLANLTASTNYNASNNPDGKLKHTFLTALNILVKGLETHQEMLKKQLLPDHIVLNFAEIGASNELDISSEETSVRIHLDGSVKVHI